MLARFRRGRALKRARRRRSDRLAIDRMIHASLVRQQLLCSSVRRRESRRSRGESPETAATEPGSTAVLPTIRQRLFDEQMRAMHGIAIEIIWSAFRDSIDMPDEAAQQFAERVSTKARSQRSLGFASSMATPSTLSQIAGIVGPEATAKVYHAAADVAANQLRQMLAPAGAAPSDSGRDHGKGRNQ
jgi:hypothetical protein